MYTSGTRPPKELTAKDLSIIDSYLNNGKSQVKAFLEHGYSDLYANSQAYVFFNKPRVKELIAKRLKEMEKKIGIDKEWCLEQLKEVALNGENSEKVRAISEINKMLGHYEPDKIDLNGKLDIVATEVIKATEEVKKKYERSY